jgi:hypothetical protein
MQKTFDHLEIGQILAVLKQHILEMNISIGREAKFAIFRFQTVQNWTKSERQKRMINRDIRDFVNDLSCPEKISFAFPDRYDSFWTTPLEPKHPDIYKYLLIPRQLSLTENNPPYF